MTDEIYLKNIKSGSIFRFNDLEESKTFLDSYNSPNHIIRIEAYYCDGGGFNGNYSVIAFGLNHKITSFIFDNNLTINVAEYLSCYCAMTICSNHDLILSDSQLIVNQVNNKWECRKPYLQAYNSFCKFLMKTKNLALRWIPRHQNYAGIYIEKNKRTVKE